jgi:hypothetical protein
MPAAGGDMVAGTYCQRLTLTSGLAALPHWMSVHGCLPSTRLTLRCRFCGELRKFSKEREREERDFKLVAALRNEPEGATLDEMRKKYGL